MPEAGAVFYNGSAPDFRVVDRQQPDRKLVVVCAGTAWDGIKGSDRHMTNELSRYADVLWVDPAVSALKASRWTQLPGTSPQLLRIKDNPKILRLSPIACPGHTRPVIRATTGPLVRSQIRRALRTLGRNPAAVIACGLDDVLSGWEPGVVRVLYGTDDYSSGAGLLGIDEGALKRAEKRQLTNADVVTAVSQVLAGRWSAMGADVHVVPNGVEVDAYADVGAAVLAPDVSLSSPVAGVIGHLSARIDIGILEAIVDAGCSLLLVGPYNRTWEPERFEALVSRPGVQWVGRRPFEDLPAYLSQMDVGVTPYADTGFNRAAFPLKTLEYLAAGLPVVSSDLPASRWLGSRFVRIANSPEDFGRAIHDLATQAADPSLRQQRRALASCHSWKRRAHEFAAIIGLADTGSNEETSA